MPLFVTLQSNNPEKISIVFSLATPMAMSGNCVSSAYPLWWTKHCWVMENAPGIPGNVTTDTQFVILQMQGLSPVGHRFNHHYHSAFK